MFLEYDHVVCMTRVAPPKGKLSPLRQRGPAAQMPIFGIFYPGKATPFLNLSPRSGDFEALLTEYSVVGS